MMLAMHWLKSAALVSYLAGVLFILQRCTYVFTPAPAPAPAAVAKSPPDLLQMEIDDARAQQERDQEKRRKDHERANARRQAAHQAREAALKSLRDKDLPVALAEYVEEAERYRKKLSDLARLSPAERWERENPVKDTRTRAYQLAVELYALDREAQKEREGPTEYLESDIALLKQRIVEFSKSGEGLAEFASGLPAFAGKVPEPLMLETIDAIVLAVLPANAFDPCRDPKACPKPPADEARSPSAPLTTLLRVAAWARESELLLRLKPDSREPNAGRVTHGQLVRATGRRATESLPGRAPNTWLEVADGPTYKWALDKIFEHEAANSWRQPPPNAAPVKPPTDRSRNPNSFYRLW